MMPDSRSSFDQMLYSFAYTPTGGDDDGAPGGTGKKQKTTKEEPTAKGEKRSPAAPQTPPRPSRREGPPSSLPAAGGHGTMGSEALASTSTLELVLPACPATPLNLPPGKGKCKNSGSYQSCLRKVADGKPAVTSHFFRHRASAPAGWGRSSWKAAAARSEGEQIELMEGAGEEGKNKRDQAGDTIKTKKRRKGSSGGSSGPPERNKVEGDDGRKQKKKKKKKKKKKVVVVSPYFTASSAEQRAPVGGACAGEEVKVVVLRRTRKKRTTRQASESAATGPPASSGDRQSPGEKKSKKSHQSVQLTAAGRMADAYKRVPDDNPWVPPFSDHDLLQEFHFFDHWRVLVICMLLNRTTGREVKKVLPRLFLLCPDAETTTKVAQEEIEEIIKHLGLQKKRSMMIKRMSEEYLQPEWTHVTQLHGIGKYAADAYAIFCSGMWKEVKPNDHKLVDYWRFLINDKDARESITVQKST